jgi:hypothetical protein
MAQLTLPDLRDPAPPVPGAAERAAVAARASRLTRRRHVMQGVGALAVVVALAGGVAVLTGGGRASGPDSRPVAAAAAPSASPTVTVSGHVTGIPEGATLTLQLTGAGRTFTAIADSAGNFSSDVPPGTYTGSWTWESADHTASSAGRIDGIDLTTDYDASFSVTGAGAAG